MALRIVEKATLSDVGRARQSNEDSFFERSPLFAVADGMGGARAGEVASRMAVEELAAMDDSGARAEERLREIARGANRRIYEMAQADSEHAGMGTTFTAVLVTGREVAVGHVGDSRLYRLRDGTFERLTDDHSLVEELVRQGKLTPEEAEVHPQRSIITRALGPEGDVQVDTFTHAAKDGDVYLLCSDGLSGMVSDDAMAQILTRSASLEEGARALIDAANANGGKDNITAVLFRMAEDEGATPDSDTLGDAATQVGVSPAAAHEAAPTEQQEQPAPTEQQEQPAPAAPAPTEGETMALPPEEAARARAEASARADPAPAPRTTGAAPRAGAAPRRPRPPRPRLGGGAALFLVLLALVAVGLYVGSRQIYFLGTDSRGAVSLFRGLPYELPLGVDLYTHEYSSSVPASAIADRRQRTRLLDHKARSRSDAERRIRELERAETPR
ncbi:MAG: family protein phosphatase [Thermoleophilaceae bacterium]|jgi:protein phosphatase|nr:family protein phosphatase [Thermoleophilaceae bacterium]